MNEQIDVFLEKLSSKAPTPGGGGASALLGAIGASLGSMVASLTSGKKKYAEYQQDIEDILVKTKVMIETLLKLIDKDAQVFQPLSKAYGIPKEDPTRDEVLENALKAACTVPYEILCETVKVIDILEELSQKGSRLAISDVGVAAAACRSAIEGAALNVYINTKLMKDKDYAKDMNQKTTALAEKGTKRCSNIYELVLSGLRR